MPSLFQPSEKSVRKAFVRIAGRMLKADQFMPGGDVETRLRHEFHLLRATTAFCGLLGIAGLIASNARDNVDPLTPLISTAILFTSIALARRYQTDRIAMPLVLQHWQAYGPDHLRKFIAHNPR